MPSPVRCGRGAAHVTVDGMTRLWKNLRRRFLPHALIAGSVVAGVGGAARPQAVPAPAPVHAAPPRSVSVTALAERYAQSRDDIRAAERMAVLHGDRWRAAMLRAMAAPARRFLSFDGRDGGRAVEVFGDLPAAGRIAVLVPGADTDLDRYGLLRGGALRLRRALVGGAVVIAWLGYRTPSTVSVAALTTGPADEAAPALRAFVRWLTAAAPAARVSVLCHSYGTVVCARAASGLGVAGIVLFGSAGVPASRVADLGTGATVWAGRGGGDWVAHVPHLRLRLPFADLGLGLGLGADPVAPRFGARVFAAGDGGHSDYLKAGSVSLRSIARIVSGRDPREAAPDA